MNKLKGTLIAIYCALLLMIVLGLLSRCTPDNKEKDPLPPVREKFEADVVLCIDATGSMGTTIEMIKENATSFYDDVKTACRKEGKVVESMNLCVVAFRDIDVPENKAIEKSEMFSMPSQSDDLRSFLSGVKAYGGGSDVGELGLDAIAWAYAETKMKKKSDRKLIVILWSDETTKSITSRPGSHAFGHGISSFEEFTRLWNTDDNKNSRIVLFTPGTDSWENVANTLRNVTRHDFTVSDKTLEYDEILKIISEDV